MNKLEEITNELLNAGYTLEEIKNAFEVIADQAKQIDTDKATDNN